jgi:hypothetical protein
MSRCQRLPRLAALVASAALALPVTASAGQFSALGGTWSGAGHVSLENGKRESLKCRAYYTPKEGGDSLGLAIRCASASNRIELRATLHSNGGRIGGTWEERTFNASGSVAGQGSAERLRLSISGGGFSGSMSVTTAGRTQSIAVSANGVGFKGINISMRRE